MATVEVATWGELVEAAATSGVDTIMITQDIDCNDEIPLGVESSIDLAYKTLDGQGHTIRNLRTHVDNPVSIFVGGRMFLTNIDFINLIVNNAYLMENNGYNNFITADHCRFVGRRNHTLIDAGDTSPFGCYLQYSYFNIPCSGSADELISGRAGATLMGFCWVRDTNDGRFADNAINNKAVMQGCYFDGDLILNSGQTTVEFGGNNSSFSPSVQNVYDLDIRATADVSSDEFTFNFYYGLVKNQVRSMDRSEIYTPIITPASGVILATPEEMTSPQALYNKGFDIVVP